MDQNRFDALTRWLSGAPTRRLVLRGLAGAGLGLGVARTPLPAAAGCAKLGQTCKTRRGKKRCCGGAKCQGKRCRCPADREPCGATCCAKGSTCEGRVCVPCDVCRSGCAFSSVQAAINAADPGTTIRLCPGSYPEHVAVDKNLTLLGAGAARTILDGGGTASSAAVLGIGAGAKVQVRALTVTGGNGGGGGGGVSNRGDLTLEDVRVTGNKANFGAGIHSLAAVLRLNGSRVSGNEAFVTGGGLYIEGGATSLNESDVTGNEAASLGGGLYLQNHGQLGPVVTFNGVQVSGNAASSGGGIYKASNSAMTIEPGSVTGNTPDNCAGEAVGNCAN